MTKLSDERMIELMQALRDAERLPRRPGVLTLTRGRVDSACLYWTIYSGQVARPAEEGLDPIDFNDDATVGVLAGQARELWDDPDMYCRALSPRGRRWGVYRIDGEAAHSPVSAEHTEAEAWVGAILRAPGGVQ